MINSTIKSLKDDATKLEVIQLDYAGLTRSAISERTGIPKTTITDFLNQDTHGLWWKDNRENVQQLALNSGANIWFIDIETAPIMAYVWGLYDQNVAPSQIVEDWQILCVSAKRLGKDEWFRVNSAYMYLTTPSELGNFGLSTDFQGVAEELHKLLDAGDIFIAHNGIRFDNRKIRAKLIEAGLPPPTPYKVIDTLKVIKTQFGFTSNRMDYISKLLGGDGKHDTGGMQLWIDCMNGCPSAWEKMIKYCDNDILELERIYMETRAWDNKHPNLQVYYKDSQERCGTCGSANLTTIVHKQASTNTSSYEILKCEDCQTTKRRRKNLRSREQMQNTLMNIS